MWILILVLGAVGILLSPDLRANPLAVVFAVFILLGAAGLAYGKYLRIRSQQAMIDLERRKRE